MRILSLLWCFYFLPVSVHGQGTLDAIEIHNQAYIKLNGQWFADADGDRTYPVDPSVVTVKLKDRFLGSEEIVVQRHGSQIVRQAKTGFLDLQVPPEKDAVAFALALQTDSAFEIVELNTIGVYLGVPNDPRFGEQWFHSVIQTPEAWDLQAGNPAITVAVIDSGTEFDHPDLGLGADSYQNVWLNKLEDAWIDPNDPQSGNGQDDGGNSLIDDWKGWDFDQNNNDGRGPFNHGSNVAGIIGGKINNGVGIAGIAGGFHCEGVKTMICGIGEFFPNGSVIDDAILYAVENGANIIQISFGIAPSSAVDAALQMAYEEYNVLIVCSAGNDNGASSIYPASSIFAMSVSASNETDDIPNFSNRGPLIEVAAPGRNILTTNTGTEYNLATGTSFASPMVSGVAALMWSRNPELTNEEVRQILKDTAEKVGGFDYNWNPEMPGHSIEFGYGRINAFEAVKAVIPATILFDVLDGWPTSISIVDLFPFLPLPICDG